MSNTKCPTGKRARTAPHSPGSRHTFSIPWTRKVNADRVTDLAGKDKTIGPSGACGQNQWLDDRNAVPAGQDADGRSGRPAPGVRWAACPAMFWPLSVSPNLTADTRGHHDRRIDRYADRIGRSRPAVRAHACSGPNERLEQPAVVRRRPRRVVREPRAVGTVRARRVVRELPRRGDVQWRYGRKFGRHWRHGRHRVPMRAAAVQRIPVPAVHMRPAAPAVSRAGPRPAAAASPRPGRRSCR